VKVRGDPPGIVGVHVCGGVVTAGACVQPAEPPIPAAMKLMSRTGKPVTTLNEMNGWGANTTPTGSVAEFKLSMVFCPFSRRNEPVPPDKVNMSAMFGARSLCHVLVVAVAVTIPLIWKLPEMADADKVVNNPGRSMPKTNHPILVGPDAEATSPVFLLTIANPLLYITSSLDRCTPWVERSGK
jgi:hypothetical protein